MDSTTKTKKRAISTGHQMAEVCAILVLLIGLAILCFLKFYNTYNDGVLYSERLNQMQEVTEQLFSGLEDVVESQWQTAKYQRNYLIRHTPSTIDELTAVMQEKVELSEMDSTKTDMIAVDSEGRFYTQHGEQGLLYEMKYLADNPERASFISNSMTTTETQMMFLYRLDEPITILDDGREVKLIYYGIARDMTELNPYFDCEAYNGNNSVYVINNQGLKLFSGSSNKDLLEGYNTFAVLRKMNYLHGSSFDTALQELQEDGHAYSNAVLNGVEYYYALYQMNSAEWVLLFLVPSDYVATGTV